MNKLQIATKNDWNNWNNLDTHLSQAQFEMKVREDQAYFIMDDDQPIGVLRYNYFWDEIPFLTLLYIDEDHRGKHFGSDAMNEWEQQMKLKGYDIVMLSTQIDESAQHFYRKLGYQDRGSLFLDGTPIDQPQELIMLKILKSDASQTIL